MANTSLTLEEAVEHASAAYRPGSMLGGVARNVAIEEWADAVGRERALADLAAVVKKHGSRRKAARALQMSFVTFQRFEGSFAAAPLRAPRGLTLTFDTRLHRLAPAALEVLISELFGDAAGVTVEERSPFGADGPSFIRVNGNDPDQLAAVAQAFYDRIWRVAEAVADQRAMERVMPRGMAMVIERLDALRDGWSAATINHPSVQAMLADQAESHALARTDIAARIERLDEAVKIENKRVALHRLLSALFTPCTLHAWVSIHHGPEVADQLPGPTAPHGQVVAGAVEAWERRGVLTRELFARLEERVPEQREVIWGVAGKWGLDGGP